METIEKDLKTSKLPETEERCNRICKGNCISDANHIKCIADIVINKSWTAREIICKARKECSCSHLDFLLQMVSDNLDELLSWAKKLQNRSERQFNPEVVDVFC